MITKFYTGCVEDRNDPLKLGRCQVRIVGLHTEDKTILPTADLPWAFPVTPITSANTSGIGQSPLGPVEGTWVLIAFMDPDQQMPMMMGTLGGVAQIPNSTDDPGKIVLNEVSFSGQTTPTDPSTGQTVTPPDTAANAGSTGSANSAPGNIKDGKTIEGQITGPLAGLIAKGESGSAGYDAFNRGSNAPPGTGSTGGEKLTLTSMTIKDIMAQQALPTGDPKKLFAVGKYQCIPVTLTSACKALNIDIDTKFTPQVQDIICQEYLVGRKRPKLIAYYRNPDKNSETLLKEAGKSLAAEFASIEDPYYPGYPYGGPTGTYYKNGNKVHTTYEKIKATLLHEWDFRNNQKSPPPTATIASGDKIDKGTDYTGVAVNYKPIDDSSKTGAVQSASAPAAPDAGGFGIGNLPIQVPPELAALGKATGLGDLGLPADLLSGIASIQNDIKSLVSSVDINGALKDILPDTSILHDFGGSLSEVATTLGIPNVTGSVTELVQNLGLASYSPDALIRELETMAGSTTGQAKALLTKLQNEPTKPNVAPIGQKNPDGTISNGTGVDPTKGFQDPNGVYPKYKNEQDSNRLATGNNLGRTIVLEKEASLVKDVPVANGGTWDQVGVPYKAKYPYNHVTQYEAGHVVEYDSTPESERIHIYHKKGTFVEIDANGTQVNRIVGDGYEIIERNGNVYVKGALNVTVDGAYNLRTDNALNIEVSGASIINVYNDCDFNVSGNMNMAVGGSFNLAANQINLESSHNINIKAKTGIKTMAGSDIHTYSEGTMFMQADGNISQKTSGFIAIETEGDANIKSAGLVNIQSQSTTNIKSASGINLQAESTVNLKSASDFNIGADGTLSLNTPGIFAIDAAEVDMQDGNSNTPGDAGEAESAKPAEHAKGAELELPVETRGTSGTVSFPPLTVPGRGGEVGFDGPNTGDSKSYVAGRIQNNQSSKTDAQSNSIVLDKNVPAAKPSTVPVGASCDAIFAMDSKNFTAGMKLSKHFTLGDLTKGGERIPRQSYVVDGVTLTPQEIVCNLKGLAENLLDPIADKYGRNSFVITSAFRRPPVGDIPGDLGAGHKEGGDHPRGCAADISFTAGRKRMHEIASELTQSLPTWNQIILEYDGPSKTWIHCAFRYSGNKGDYFTMNQHKTFAGTYPRGGFALV